jgi:hypothetical protein
VYGQSIAQVLHNIISTQQFKHILSEFFIPNSLGKITNSNFSASDTIIINIQDLHLHPNVQKNIAYIIELFDKKYGVKNVYMEGAFGDVDTSWLSNIKDKKTKQKIVNNILNTGMLTGPEYYSIISNRPHLIKGLENKSPYLQNLQRFGDILYSQNEISSILSSIDKDILYLRSIYSNKRQLKIESLFKDYHSGKISPKKFYALISNYAQRFGIDIQPIFNKQSGSIEIDNSSYKNITTFIALLQQSDKINYSQASTQLKSLILHLKQTLPYQAFKMITDQSSNFKDIDKLYAFIINFSKQLNIDLSINFPELNKLFNQVELNKNINPISMLDEEERLEDQLSIALATDQGSKEVAFLSWFADEFYNYFSTSITSDNYDWYKQHIKEWKRLYIKYLDNKKLSLLAPYETLVDSFYNVNIDRNQYFFDNLSFLHDSHKLNIHFDSSLSDTEKVIKSLDNSKNISVVVTGGFHTQYLNDMLAKQGISFIVITPTVDDGVELAKQAYHSLAKEQSKILSTTLAALNMSQNDINQRLIGLSDVLVQRGYSTQALSDFLQEIASSLDSDISISLSGGSSKSEPLTLKINDKTYIYNHSDGIFTQQPLLPSTSSQQPLAKSSKTAGLTAMINFISATVSIPFLILIPMMSWALPFMIIPLLIFIPSSIVASYALWQRNTILNAKLTESELVPLQIPATSVNTYIKSKLLLALHEDLYDQVKDIIELKDNIGSGIVMEYDIFNDKININLTLARQLFFDPLANNTINQKLFINFIQHELAHRQFANPENKIRFFIHNNFKWLEELLVSFADLFRAITFKKTMYPQKHVTSISIEEIQRALQNKSKSIVTNSIDRIKRVDNVVKFMLGITISLVVTSCLFSTIPAYSIIISPFIVALVFIIYRIFKTGITNLTFSDVIEFIVVMGLAGLIGYGGKLILATLHDFVSLISSSGAIAMFLSTYRKNEEAQTKVENTKNEINKKLNLITSIKFIVILLLSIPDLLKSLPKYSQKSNTSNDEKIKSDGSRIFVSSLKDIIYWAEKIFPGINLALEILFRTLAKENLIIGFKPKITEAMDIIEILTAIETKYNGVKKVLDLIMKIMNFVLYIINLYTSIKYILMMLLSFTLKIAGLIVSTLFKPQNEWQIETDIKKPLTLFVSGSKEKESSTFMYAKTIIKESNYSSAVVEHISSDVFPRNYIHKMSVNTSFNNLIYEVYVRNEEGIWVIGLKLQDGQDSFENFSSAVQFFANDLNTNSVLMQEFNSITNLGISSEGVIMMDFIGFSPDTTTQESVQKLYRTDNTDSGLVGTYSVEDLVITPENLITIEQNIKATRLFKLDEYEKFYEVTLTYQKLPDTDFTNALLERKKKEGATTIILNIDNFDISELSSETTKDIMKKFITKAHLFGMRINIQVNLLNAKEEIFETYLGIGFDGISIDAKESDDIESIMSVLESLKKVSKGNSIVERNTIILKNKSLREHLANLGEYNVLALVVIDDTSGEAVIDKQQQLKAKYTGYKRGRKILEQNIDTTTTNIRELLNLMHQKPSSISSQEIKITLNNVGVSHVVRKHIEIILQRASDNETGSESEAVLEAIGFLRGFIESYVVNQYLQAFNLSYEETFNMINEHDVIDTLKILLTALFITDVENKIFESPETLKNFFDQTRLRIEKDQSLNSESLLNLNKQIVLFAKDIIEKLDEEESIDPIVHSHNQDNPYQKLHTYIVVTSDLINTLSFREVINDVAKIMETSVSTAKNILSAA